MVLLRFNVCCLMMTMLNLSSQAFGQIPSSATEAWAADRVSLLTGQPRQLSKHSFSATIHKIHRDKIVRPNEIEDIDTDRTVYVAKLDDAVLISETNGKYETRTIFRDATYHRIRRKIEGANWILQSSGKYETDSTKAGKKDLFWDEVPEANAFLIYPWSVGVKEQSPKGKVSESGGVLTVEYKKGDLSIPYYARKYEFDSENGYRRKSYVFRYENGDDWTDTVETYSNYGKDGLSYREVETTKGLETVPEGKITFDEVQECDVVITAKPPDKSEFDLATYNVIVMTPTPSTTNYLSMLPAIVGVMLIAAAVWLKRRQWRET